MLSRAGLLTGQQRSETYGEVRRNRVHRSDSTLLSVSETPEPPRRLLLVSAGRHVRSCEPSVDRVL